MEVLEDEKVSLGMWQGNGQISNKTIIILRPGVEEGICTGEAKRWEAFLLNDR